MRTCFSVSLRLYALACMCALAHVASYAAGDDSAVANRKWVRAEISKAVSAMNTAVRVGTGDVWQASSPIALDGEYSNATATVSLGISVPTNQALYIRFSKLRELPSGGWYARVPGQNLYVSTNAYLSAISYSVTNWTEYATNELGGVIYARRMSTRFRARSIDGKEWSTAYIGGDTVLARKDDPSVYFSIRRSFVNDAKRRALLGVYETALAKPSRTSIFALLVPEAFAEEHLVQDLTGGGTLKFHAALDLYDMFFDINRAGSAETLYFRLAPDDKDHQYQPYGKGFGYEDLGADESQYLDIKTLLDPRNWGFGTFIVCNEVRDDGTFTGGTFKITYKELMASRAWQDIIARAAAELPVPPFYDTPIVSDSREHNCKVFDENGKHIGCVCDFRFCKYCPDCASEYTVTTKWSDGTTSESVVALRFEGPVHNFKRIVLREDGAYEDARGCKICVKEDGMNFCGCENLTDAWGYECANHEANELAVSGVGHCGCLCGSYNNNTLVPADMHLHPEPGAEDHVIHDEQRSACWCYCKRQHDGIYSREYCPNNCQTCGAYKTINGESIDGTFANPLPYQTTDDGGDPDLDDHTPSEARCGCVCGAISPDNDETYPLMKEESSFHHTPEEGCTCECRRQMHKVINDTGHCKNVCTRCGKTNKRQLDEDGDYVIKAVWATWDEHTPDAKICACECYAYSDGYVGPDMTHCGYRANEDGPDKDKAWHKVKKPVGGVRYCCCDCGTYQDHAANGGEHAEWFISGDVCKSVCKGVNKSGARCGKVIGTDRAALWQEHTPSKTQCGCECNAQDGKYGFCGTESGINHADDYHVRDGDSCNCICKASTYRHAEWMTPRGNAVKCANVCVCGKVKDGSRDAIVQDHTALKDACGCNCGYVDNRIIDITYHNGANGCRCQCGRLHKWYNGNLKGVNECSVCSVCGMTENDGDGSFEHLHKLNPSTDACACWCKYYKTGGRTAKTQALHKPLETEDENGTQCCYCRCGVSVAHFFRDGSPCAGVCYYCKERDETGAKVGEEAHAHFTSGASRCGCQCGNITASSAADRFHYPKSGTCVCLGADGNGGTRHFKHPGEECKGICAYLIDGWAHKTADYDKQILSLDAIKDDGSERAIGWHTPGYLTGWCGCACQKYGLNNTSLWRDIKPTWHCNDTTRCGCYCGDPIGLLHDDWHAWGTSTPECVCQCSKQLHQAHGVANGDPCRNVCKFCWGVAGTTRYTGIEAPKGLHDPSSTACGCACGHFKGEDYKTEVEYHMITPDGCWDVCNSPAACNVFKMHTRFDPNACGKCKTCGLTEDGKYFDRGMHQFQADKCICKCEEIELDHDMKKEGESSVGNYTCEICSAVIEVFEVVYKCQRCGYTETSTKNVGTHGQHYENEPEGTSFFCEGCSCSCAPREITTSSGDKILVRACESCLQGWGQCDTCGAICGEHNLQGGETNDEQGVNSSEPSEIK